MLRIHFLQLWFTLSDPAIEEAFFDTPLYREFAQFQELTRLPDESTILRFGKTPSPRHRLEKNKLAGPILATVNEVLVERGLLLKVGTVVDAALIAAPSSTRNKDGLRDAEMHLAQKGNQWHFGMKAHIGVDVDSGLVHTVLGTSANVNDVVEGNALLHGEEEVAFGDADYQGIDKRADANAKVRGRMAHGAWRGASCWRCREDGAECVPHWGKGSDRAANCDGRTCKRSIGSFESFKRDENSRILKSTFR